jgi:hypothetical protein
MKLYLFAVIPALFSVSLVCAGTGNPSEPNDSTKQITVYSGSVGFTNNGFSIIPTFSLNSPAVVSILSWRKNKFSVGPDIRITPGLSRGGMLLWFRYYPIEKKRFTFRVGTHPALNIQSRDIVVNGKPSTISQMRRFIAWELNPNFVITKKWSAGIYYLQGNGLQLDGPRRSHFVTLNTTLSRIELSRSIRFTLIAAVYYLNLDENEGTYLTSTAILRHLRSPFSLESSINETFKSNLPNNKEFMWNVTLNYNFRKVFRRQM